MKWKYILILVLAFSLDACKKITHTDTSIKGKVINQTDNTPLVGYSVYLQERETPFSATEPPVSTTLDIRITDSNGEIDFGEWEFRKNSTYSYFVVFDNNGEEFATNKWQEGDYSIVETEKQLEKGTANTIELLQVPFGNKKFVISNKSTIETIEVEVYLSNSFFERRSFLNQINKDETFSYNVYTPSVAGKTLATYYINDVNSNFSDTINQEIEIPHNKNTDIYFTYPPQ